MAFKALHLASQKVLLMWRLLLKQVHEQLILAEWEDYQQVF